MPSIYAIDLNFFYLPLTVPLIFALSFVKSLPSCFTSYLVPWCFQMCWGLYTPKEPLDSPSSYKYWWLLFTFLSLRNILKALTALFLSLYMMLPPFHMENHNTWCILRQNKLKLECCRKSRVSWFLPMKWIYPQFYWQCSVNSPWYLSSIKSKIIFSHCPWTLSGNIQ